MSLRIGYMSDLHLEFENGREWIGDGAEEFQQFKAARAAVPGHPDTGPVLADLAGSVDCMVLAGDIWTGVRGIGYCAAVGKYLGVPVVTVAGNHEFYGHEVGALRREMAAEAAAVGVHFLDDARADLQIGGRRVAILGSTLWASMDGARPSDVVANLDRARGLADYDSIFVGSRELVPEDTLALHRAARTWLEREIPCARADADSVVVVTHHAPLMAAVVDPERNAVDFAYASPLGAMIEACRPDAWIFGHTHAAAFRQDMAGVPIVSAARGYVSQSRGWNFRPQVLELRGHQ